MKLSAWLAQRGAPENGAPADSYSQTVVTGVECTARVIDEICDHVYSARNSKSNGYEVGGILFGTWESGTLHVSATQPIYCEYESGPLIILSGHDQAALADFLANSSKFPDFRGLWPAGWYVTHRGTLSMADRDLALFDQFFPRTGQIGVVIRTDQPTPLPLAVYARAEDGLVDRSRPLFESELAPPAQSQPMPEAMTESNSAGALVPLYNSLPSLGTFTPGAMVRTLPSGAAPKAQPTQSTGTIGRGSKWEWAVAWSSCAALLAFVGVGICLYATPANLDLRLQEREGQIQATWNPGTIRRFTGSTGVVEIVDNGVRREFSLTREQVAAGSFLYVSESQDVTVRLRVSGPRNTTESARFVGGKVHTTRISSVSDIREERDQLLRENARLQVEQQKAAETVRRLEERIAELELMLPEGAGK